MGYASLRLVREALAGGQGLGSRLRRYTPPLLFLLALSAMLLAVARPSAVIMVPSQQDTIVLAIDVSGSMKAADIAPNRLVASQQAAKTFIADVPRKMKVGIVSFASAAAVVQAPTTNKEDLHNAIDRFQVQRGTATGSAIVIALAMLFPDHGITIDALTQKPSAGKPAPFGIPGAMNKPPAEWTPVPPGSNGAAAIVLITDGQRTIGPDPIEAAKFAAERGVRIYTVGIGTTKGEVLGFEGWSMRVRLDEDTLKKISEQTLGEYFQASDANELRKVYELLQTRLVFERKQTEVSALFAAGAALLAMLAAGLSLLWFNRVL